jgi:hypothetical protein
MDQLFANLRNGTVATRTRRRARDNHGERIAPRPISPELDDPEAMARGLLSQLKGEGVRVLFISARRRRNAEHARNPVRFSRESASVAGAVSAGAREEARCTGGTERERIRL